MAAYHLPLSMPPYMHKTWPIAYHLGIVPLYHLALLILNSLLRLLPFLFLTPPATISSHRYTLPTLSNLLPTITNTPLSSCTPLTTRPWWIVLMDPDSNALLHTLRCPCAEDALPVLYRGGPRHTRPRPCPRPRPRLYYTP